MAASDELRSARARIERGWTQGASARDRQGTPVPPYAMDAAAWDCFGALGGGHGRHQTRALALLHEIVGEPVHRWNDASGRTKAEILAAFDRAIEMAEAEERP